MGEWSWDSRTGSVTWDANTAMLFGIAEGQFGGTFEEWISHVDERDRAMVREAVANGVAQRGPFRFDHRCVWPDGSVHWVEGIGDVIVAANSDEVIGAFGLAIDVDDRHREIEERNRLLEVERSQRERMEYLARVNDVLAFSFDAAEIVQRVTESVVPELAEWCSIVVSVDRRRDRPSIMVAHRDPEKVKWAEQLLRDYPYDPDANWGAARVIRSGRPEVVERIDPARVLASRRRRAARGRVAVDRHRADRRGARDPGCLAAGSLRRPATVCTIGDRTRRRTRSASRRRLEQCGSVRSPDRVAGWRWRHFSRSAVGSRQWQRRRGSCMRC